MKRIALKSLLALAVVGSTLVASQAEADTFRYRQTGNWTDVTDGTTPGWGLNPNNNGSPGSLPGLGDDARINWGGNTVTVDSAVGEVSRVQIGVDESGTVVVANGGVLTATLDVLAGNNNANATGTLEVQSGGTVNIGRILWSANNNSTGVIDIQTGGVVNVASHLWWGVTGAATVTITGTLNQTGGILGLGTSDASTASGGTAAVTIGDNGVLSLNNISGSAGLPSIQAGSEIDITGTGELRLPGDLTGLLQDYVDAGKIVGEGVASNPELTIDTTKNPGFTTVYLVPVPEPSSLALLIAGGLLGARRRRG